MVLMHHISVDMVGMQIMRTELALLCGALALSQPLPELQPLEVEYADFSCWEHAQGDDKAALSWWSAHLDGVPALITLPLDHDRPPVQVAVAGHVDVHLERRLSEQFVTWCRVNGFTLNSALVSLWATLLQHLSGDTEVVVGIPHSMRYAASVTSFV
jgi:hypothetical protein